MGTIAMQEGKPALSHKRRRACVEEEDYSNEHFWDQRYQNGYSWEWYCDYSSLKPLLDENLDKSKGVLEIGCGDKPLVVDMKADGYHGQLLGTDFSQTVIDQLVLSNVKRTQEGNFKSKSAESVSSNLSFLKMDARHLDCPCQSMGAVIDKGTIDAMLCAPGDGWRANATAVAAEAGRVLAAPGCLVVVSHIDPENSQFEDYIQAILEGFVLKIQDPVHLHLDIHCAADADKEDSDAAASKEKVGEREKEDEEGGYRKPPTVYILRKRAGRQTRRWLAAGGAAGQRRAAAAGGAVAVAIHEH